MSTNPGQQDLFASNQDDKNAMATAKEPKAPKDPKADSTGVGSGLRALQHRSAGAAPALPALQASRRAQSAA